MAQQQGDPGGSKGDDDRALNWTAVRGPLRGLPGKVEVRRPDAIPASEETHGHGTTGNAKLLTRLTRVAPDCPQPGDVGGGQSAKLTRRPETERRTP